MKKKLLFIALLLFFIPSVKAASVTIALKCPSVAVANSNITCDIVVTSDIAINGLSANYGISGLSYVSFAPQSGFTTYSSSASGFAIGNNSGKTGTFTVGTITLKASAAGSITLSNIDASDTSFNSYSAGSMTTNIRLASTNNSLKGLTISGGSLSPSFSANTLEYTATVESDSITIGATKGDNSQSITGLGSFSLVYGTNVFKVTVTSESGSSKTYTLTIMRPDKRSSNSYLKSLSLEGYSLSFNKDNTSYNADVESNVTSIKVNAAVEDSKAVFVDGHGPRTVNLNYGNNHIEVKVRAENQGVRTYVINVNRKDDRSTNTNLKSLTLSQGTIIFNKDTLEYNITVNYDITKIDVKATVEDSKSTININNPELVVGDNVILVDVTAENGSVKTYKINVKRLSEAEKMSDNNEVKTLSIFGHEIKFKNDVYKYNIELGKDEKELLFDITLDDEKATYAIENNKNLKKGSIISLFVISESGIKNEYQFTISKVKGSGVVLTIIISLLAFIIGFVLGFICCKFIKKNKKDDKNNLEEIKEEKIEQTNIEYPQVVEEIKTDGENLMEVQRQEELNKQESATKEFTSEEIKEINEIKASTESMYINLKNEEGMN